MNKRKVAFWLGLIGGILGIIAVYAWMLMMAFGFTLHIGRLQNPIFILDIANFHIIPWNFYIPPIFYSKMLFGVFGIIGAVTSKHRAKLGGILMIIGAVGGLLSIGFLFYLVPFVLLLLGGLISLRKEKG